jgi:hypothetical protein
VLIWRKFVQSFDAKELIEAKKIMDTVIKYRNKGTAYKIMEIGSFLYNKFHKQTGNPSSDFLKLSPIAQFNTLCRDDSAKLWCGNFAEMFALFCWSQNIVCRVVEIFNEGDHHELNECFNSENNQWIMVDVTFNQLLTRDKHNKFIPLVDFQNLLIKGDSLFAIRASSDSIITTHIDANAYYITNYYKKEKPLYYYHEVNLKKVYSTLNKIKRYFLPVSWYDIYDRNERSNLLFYIKELFALMWLSIFGVLLFAFSRRKVRVS